MSILTDQEVGVMLLFEDFAPIFLVHFQEELSVVVRSRRDSVKMPISVESKDESVNLVARGERVGLVDMAYRSTCIPLRMQERYRLSKTIF